MVVRKVFILTFEKTRLPGDKKVAVNGSVTDEKGPIGDIILADSGRTCRRKKCNSSSYPQKQMRLTGSSEFLLLSHRFLRT
ncbi:hypothetical protein BPAE_0031g00380 [Botrytis paeoniae]|uniref:Uncharacterized protein n=1 Tax=Botrytis paeoniae TaxID=278948 RepID=A0A4Z1G1N3_9HELO|nr:hypothetical protein BPAE_0031g00380 [Botrytis paeoniae]